MTALTALPRALVNAGLAEEPKSKKKQGKIFKCHRCKTPMVKFEDTNVMVCPQCNNYFIFDKVM